jgi:hypothetical protein
MLYLSSPAAAGTSVVADAEADIATSAPAHLDILQAKITEQVGREALYFQMELAAAVPETPAGLPAFTWNIDVPGGRDLDYTVTVRWCSAATVIGCAGGAAHWEALRLDFSFSPPRQTVDAFRFRIDGATVKAWVDPAALGDPTAFRWNAFGRVAPPSVSPLPVDRAPDSGLTTFTR